MTDIHDLHWEKEKELWHAASAGDDSAREQLILAYRPLVYWSAKKFKVSGQRFADIVQETAIAMQARQMSMRNYLPQSIIIHGNYSLLYSIFRNLVDNAISYAGQGTTVEVWAEQQPDCWRFTFRDNGIGIPAEHLPRIFERFYRIDKGRSREMGGTGLGLAIVKNAILQHGGSITATIPDAGGLEFRFTIAK